MYSHLPHVGFWYTMIVVSLLFQPRMCLLSFALKANFASERDLKSCAVSRCRITTCAICIFSFASEMMELLHFLSAMVVECNLWPKRWKGSVWCVGRLHACCTVSWKHGNLVQKFSNLKGRGLRGPESLASRSGQWSEWEEERVCSMWSSKAMSQALLQKKRSRRESVGWRLSLLHVYFQFWRCISFRPQKARVLRKRRISWRFNLLLFLSCALQMRLKSPMISHFVLVSSFMFHICCRKAIFSSVLVGLYTIVHLNLELHCLANTVVVIEKHTIWIPFRSIKLASQRIRIPPLVPCL